MKQNHMHTYRKIVIVLFAVLPFIRSHAQTYSPSLHVQVNDAVAVAPAAPLEARSMYYDGPNFLYRAFQSTSEVLSYLNTTNSRTGNFIIIVDSGGTLQSNGTYLNPHNTYYMFADSTTSGQLKKMNLFGAGIGTCSGCLLAANDLSDLGSVATSLVNLGLNNVNNTSDATKNAATVSLTNHTIDATQNTLLNIPNSALANDAIGLTLISSGVKPQVTTTPAALGQSLVITVPWTNGTDSGFLKGTDWVFFDGKLDSIHVSNDSLYNCVNGTCTFAALFPGGGAVSSVNPLDASLIFSPTTGNVLGKVNPNFAFNWTGQHTFSGFAPIFSTLTTAGGLFYGTGTGQMSQTNGGTNAQIMESTGGGTPPQFYTPSPSDVEGWLGFTPLTAALPSTNIFVGNGSNIATAVAMSGDATLSNTGALTVGTNKISNTKLAQMPDSTIKSNLTNSTANAADNSISAVAAALAPYIAHNFQQTLDIGNTADTAAIFYLLTTTDTIYWFGDSYTFGYVASDSTFDFASLDSKRLRLIQYNDGVPGSTLEKGTPLNPFGATNMVDRISLIPHYSARSRYLFFAFGLNDIGWNAGTYDTAHFSPNYIQIIDTALARGWPASQIFVINTFYLSSSGYAAYAALSGNSAPTLQRQLDYNTCILTITQRTGVHLIDMYGYQLIHGGANYVSGDNIHPGNYGHSVISDGVLQGMGGIQALIQDSAEMQVSGIADFYSQIRISGNDSESIILRDTADAEYLSFQRNQDNGKIVFGNQTATATANVAQIDMGGTYAAAANTPAEAKLLLLNGTGAGIYGFGVSASGLEAFTGNVGYFTVHGRYRVDGDTMYIGNLTGAQTVPPFISMGTSYAASSNDPAHAMLRFVDAGASTYGLSASAGMGLEVFGGGVNIITLHGNTTIDQSLNVADSVQIGDVPVGNSSMPVLVWNQASHTLDSVSQSSVRNGGHTIFTPTTGGTVNLVNNQYNIINPAGTLLALTVNLPSSPANNDVVQIKYTQQITTVTYANGTVADAITLAPLGGLIIYRYDSATSTWY